MIPVCPYCLKLSGFTDSFEIYGKSYGMIYLCRPCNAFVGVHKGTNKPLGRLANAELREWKKRAHSFFDPLWEIKRSFGFHKNEARGLAYKWLAREMKIESHLCHIGMFDIDQCKSVVKICQKYFIPTSLNPMPVNDREESVT